MENTKVLKNKKDSAGREKLKRYVIFLIGLFINSLGVSVITKVDLGTSPISSIPYVLSLNFSLSLGEFTILFSILLIALQILILRKNFNPVDLLQIPVSLAFGYFIDVCMALLTFVHPELYVVKVLCLLAGCIILGIGVYMEMLADVLMLPGESFVRAVVFQWKTEFGLTKIIFDVSMAVIAGILSFIFTGRLEGVREGTVVAALLVGFIARTLGRILNFLPGLLFGAGEAKKEQVTGHKKPVCIAVDRQYGSGGHDFSQKLAEKLAFQFYDGEIIRLAAGAAGYSPEYVEQREETMTNSLLYDLVSEVYAYSDTHQSSRDTIFAAESKVITDAAGKENCVIVGRCADWILRENRRCIRVFLYAPLEERIKTVMAREGLDEKSARHQIQQKDRKRADYYRYYTKHIWGMASNYHLCVDTSVGEEYLETAITGMVEQLEREEASENNG